MIVSNALGRAISRDPFDKHHLCKSSEASYAKIETCWLCVSNYAVEQMTWSCMDTGIHAQGMSEAPASKQIPTSDPGTYLCTYLAA